MYCFNNSVECQFLKLPAVVDRSVVGLITVLKSPKIMILVDSCNIEKNVSKKDGSSLFGPYILAIVKFLL